MKKIAIVRRNGLGDLLCAFPLVRYFQINEPDFKITLFLDRHNAALIPYLPPVDHTVVFPEKGNRYWNAWRIAAPFRGKFDLAICAKTSPMKLMNAFLYFLRAKERVAYVDQSWHSRLVNVPLHVEEKPMHQALKTLRMVAPELEEVPEELYPVLRVPKQKTLELPAPVVLVSATTTRKASRYAIERYADVLNQVHVQTPISVMIIGRPEDMPRANGIAARLNMPNNVYFPRNFDEFMLCLDSADVYFVGDGGVAHIGAALGKKGIVLFGETNPIEWHPLSKKMETFYHPSHVDQLDDRMILEALTRITNSGRDN